MRKGLMTGTRSTSDDINAIGRTITIDEIAGLARRAEDLGYDTLWMANVFSLDAIMTLAIAARESSRIEVGTNVTPTYPRHPTAMAQQAVTAAAACNNRFTLGIGLAHKIVIEDALGMSYDRPARHMAEYLEVLTPLLRGEVVNHDGESYHVHGLSAGAAGAEDVPLVIAALGERMLKLAGHYTDGTTTWMVGLKTLEQHIIPTMGAAAEAAGRPQPRTIAGFPILLTNEPDNVRAKLSQGLAVYGALPSYRAMLDREGLNGPEDLAILGDEATLREAVGSLRDVGVTDFNAAIPEIDEASYNRTMEFIATL